MSGKIIHAYFNADPSELTRSAQALGLCDDAVVRFVSGCRDIRLSFDVDQDGYVRGSESTFGTMGSLGPADKRFEKESAHREQVAALERQLEEAEAKIGQLSITLWRAEAVLKKGESA